MKFLLDANVEYRLATFLLSVKHDVKTIARDYPARLSDHAVLTIAVQEHRILLTNDRDFGELIFRKHYHHYGVILFRFKNTKDMSQYAIPHCQDKNRPTLRMNSAIQQMDEIMSDNTPVQVFDIPKTDVNDLDCRTENTLSALFLHLLSSDNP